MAADVYSFGALLCQMATRQPPYSSRPELGAMGLMMAVAQGQISPCDEVDIAAWPEVVMALALACCQADDEERPGFEKILSVDLCQLCCYAATAEAAAAAPTR